MRLSERINNKYNHRGPNGYIPDTDLYELIPEIEKLETDSQMLDDLIEMLQSHNLSLQQWKHGWDVTSAFYCDDGEDLSAKCATPREAIAEAVREWKKSNDK